MSKYEARNELFHGEVAATVGQLRGTMSLGTTAPATAYSEKQSHELSAHHRVGSPQSPITAACAAERRTAHRLRLRLDICAVSVSRPFGARPGALLAARPTIRQLEYLVALDAHGHIGRAAAACYVSQPTLSTQMRQLERHLGVAITERVGRGVVMTSAGRELAERARGILRGTDELMDWGRSTATELNGPLRFAAIPTVAPYLLARVLPAIRDRHPATQTFLVELLSAKLIASLMSAEIDLGLLALPVAEDTLEYDIVLEDPFLLAMAPEHPLARKSAVSMDDLAGEAVLLLDDGHCLRSQALEICQAAGARSDRGTGGTSLATICQMVAAGLGVTLVPASAAPIEARDEVGIAVRPFDDVTVCRRLALVWRRRSPAAPLYRELASMMTDRLGDSDSRSAT